MKNLFLSFSILFSGVSISQVNVYECGVTSPSVSPGEVLNGAYGFYRPCIEFGANYNFQFSGDVNKDIKASEYIHIKEGFHAGLFNPGKGVHLRIQEKSLYDVAVLNYPNLNAIEKLKKVEFGVDLEGEIEDRIKEFLEPGTFSGLDPLNPFIADDMDPNTSELVMHATFIHPSTWTVKERDFFYYHEYEQVGPGYGVDHPNYGTGEYGWSDAVNDNNDYLMRVRFAPPRAGEWEAHFSITYDGSTMQLPVFTFLVDDNNHPGFVKVHYNQRNLQREDGIVFPVGHVFPGPYNRAETVKDQTPWGYPEEIKSEYNIKVKDWNQYLGDIESYINQGGKSIKLAQTSYGNLIEFEELGNYRKRLHYAWEQDKILDMCEENDVLINFNLLFQDVIMGYGQNGRLVDENVPGNYFGEPWDYGNYGPQRVLVGNNYEPIKLGDPNSPVDGDDYFNTFCYFVPGTLPSNQFLDPKMMNYHKQRTRYYVARYGYSPQIYTWELMSEPLHMNEFSKGKVLGTNGLLINDYPGYLTHHPEHNIAMDAVNTYHNVISDFLKNDLKDVDHLITMCYSPTEDYNIYTESLENQNIDIIGVNPYAERPDKLIIGKRDKNGKNNLDVEYSTSEKNESSEYKKFFELYQKYHKPIILSEVGHNAAGCSGETGNIIDVMTYGFTGIAGMHPWEGYIYNEEVYDQRLLWPSTIYAEKFMNTNRLKNVLNKWNGLWQQGRQVEKLQNSNEIEPKELQYYLAEDNRSAVGYVRNRSFNIHTMRVNESCSQGDISPLENHFFITYDLGSVFSSYDRYLYVTGLERNLLYRTRWYDFITGDELPYSVISETDNKNRLKLVFPDLYSPQRPILWFTIEESFYNKSGSNTVDDSLNHRVIENFKPIVYPIPFTSEFKVQTNIDETIDIYSVSGTFIGRYSIMKGITKIQTNQLEPGMYYIRFNGSNVSFKVNKL